jgi:hypothetical protein
MAEVPQMQEHFAADPPEMAGVPKVHEQSFGLREISRATPQAPSSSLTSVFGAVSR